MPLMTCPDCGAAHSDEAAECPGCGKPVAVAPGSQPPADDEADGEEA